MTDRPPGRAEAASGSAPGRRPAPVPEVTRRTRVGASVLIGAFALGLLGAAAPARPAVAYPAPQPLSPVTVATLDDRYAAAQQAVAAALAIAYREDDRPRAASLERLVGRDLLEFDARGNGRVVEVVGDLAGADRIAVLVPGAHTTLDTFNYHRGPGGGARALAEEIGTLDPAARVATVAWLGYDTPQGLSPAGLTNGLARAGLPALLATLATLRSVNPDAPISLLCHSYGSVLCAPAASQLAVADLVFYGSPGVGVSSVAELATPATVWAGRAPEDWIRFVPSMRVAGVGFGADPVDPSFGARVFPTGEGGHGDYHLRGGEALRSLALIVLGEPVPPVVPHG